jgi:DNA-binding NtrC family response regulator
VAAIRTLVFHESRSLATVWARFLEREGLDASVALTAAEAIEALRGGAFDAVVLDVDAVDALGVADFAAYRWPEMPVIPVSAQTFFSDGAIFEIMPNARSVLREPLNLSDMAAVTSHYARRYRDGREAPEAQSA